MADVEEPGVGEVVEGADAAAGDGPIYRPAKGELQLTVRAVLIGCALGALICAMNVYLGLYTGWGVGGSLIAAILAYAAFATWRPRKAFTPLETNIAQTAGSAAGSMVFAAGLVAVIPAITLLRAEQGREDLTYGEMMLWTAAVAYIGVFFAVPLRRQMILQEKLRFPTGTATANTIVAMFGSGAETVRKAKALLWWAVAAAAFTLAAFFIKPLNHPPIHEWIPGAVLTTLASWTLVLHISPMLIGAGVLVGMRVSASLAAGAVVAWALLAPLALNEGWATGPIMSYDTGPRGWILWIGVAIMVTDALTSLALSLPTILRTFRRAGPTPDALDASDAPATEHIPAAWWIGGLVVVSIVMVFALDALFDIEPALTVLAIALSSVLAMIATRSTGETDINPVSGVGKVTQFVYGGVAPGQVGTNLLAAGVTGAGASQAADMMQDLKTGYLLGASPRKQFKAQLCGILAGIVFCVPIYLLVVEANPIGAEDGVPVPSAYAWKATADVVVKGFDAFPPMAEWGALAGAIFGLAIPLLRKYAKRVAPFLPSGLAFGIAFIIPAFYSFCFLIGAIAFVIWKRYRPSAAEALSFAVASGCIAGEGLMGLVTSALEVFKVQPLVK